MRQLNRIWLSLVATVAALSVVASPASGVMQLTVDDGAGSAEIVAANIGDVVGGSFAASGNTDSVISATLAVALFPVGSAAPIDFATVVLGDFWGAEAGDPVNSSGLPGGSLPDGVSFGNISSAPTPITSATGDLFDFTVDLPPSAGIWWIGVVESANDTHFVVPPADQNAIGLTAFPGAPTDLLSGAVTVVGKITAVPEPSAFAFLGLAIGGVFAVKRFRKTSDDSDETEA